MMEWYKNLYLGDTAKKKQKKWQNKIERGKILPGVWLLTLPVNPENNLDLIPADALLWETVKKTCPLIVGMAGSYEEALELVEQIAVEVWKNTGEVNIRKWILDQL